MILYIVWACTYFASYLCQRCCHCAPSISCLFGCPLNSAHINSRYVLWTLRWARCAYTALIELRFVKRRLRWMISCCLLDEEATSTTTIHTHTHTAHIQRRPLTAHDRISMYYNMKRSVYLLWTSRRKIITPLYGWIVPYIRKPNDTIHWLYSVVQSKQSDCMTFSIVVPAFV